MLDPMHFGPAIVGMLVGYIDPGLVSMAIQAVFAFAFGTIVTWILVPWSYVKAAVWKKTPSAKAAIASTENKGAEAPPEHEVKEAA